MSPVWVITLYAIAFLIISLAGLWLVQRWFTLKINRYFKEAESLTNLHRIPVRWLAALPESDTSDVPKRKEQLLRNLDLLIKEINKSPFLQDEYSRKVLDNELRGIQTLWTSSEWAQIMAWNEMPQTFNQNTD